MENGMLTKVRKLNWVLQESTKGTFSFSELCAILSELTEANVYLANGGGEIIGVNYKIKEDSAAKTDPTTGVESFPPEYNNAMLRTRDTKANFKDEEALEIFSHDFATKGKLHTLIPVQGGGDRLGTLILTRYSPKFEEADLVLAEVGATVVGIEMQRREALFKEKEEREVEAVRMALHSLSYSELEAVYRIFEELGKNEGILIASKVASRSDITRSVIVNALRKLESAAVIESRSLGMKGTHIKVLNSKFYEGLKRKD